MSSNDAFWQRISRRQDQQTLQAREASPVTVQVPKTGQQVVLERGFQPAYTVAPTGPGAGAIPTVRLALMDNQVFGQAETALWVLGLVFVLAFRLAVNRLQAWVEVLVVCLFLVTEVLLNLANVRLAAVFLKAGLAGVAILGLLSVVRHIIRSGGVPASWEESK